MKPLETYLPPKRDSWNIPGVFVTWFLSLKDPPRLLNLPWNSLLMMRTKNPSFWSPKQRTHMMVSLGCLGLGVTTQTLVWLGQPWVNPRIETAEAVLSCPHAPPEISELKPNSKARKFEKGTCTLNTLLSDLMANKLTHPEPVTWDPFNTQQTRLKIGTIEGPSSMLYKYTIFQYIRHQIKTLGSSYKLRCWGILAFFIILGMFDTVHIWFKQTSYSGCKQW